MAFILRKDKSFLTMRNFNIYLQQPVSKFFIYLYFYLESIYFYIFSKRWLSPSLSSSLARSHSFSLSLPPSLLLLSASHSLNRISMLSHSTVALPFSWVSGLVSLSLSLSDKRFQPCTCRDIFNAYDEYFLPHIFFQSLNGLNITHLKLYEWFNSFWMTDSMTTVTGDNLAQHTLTFQPLIKQN